MEIIMKVKCSPSPGADSSSHSTLKIVDHHHQLHQHTFTNVDYKASPPPSNVLPARTYPRNTPHSGDKYPIISATTSCSDCSLGYCCNISSCCIATPLPHYSQTPPSTSASPFSHPEAYVDNSPIQTVDEAEFVSIDDEKVKQYLIRLGQQRQQPLKQFPTHKEPKITRVVSAPTSYENTLKPVVYEIIELDDEDEREKLKQIKQQAERSLANRKYPSSLTINFANRHTKSLHISLIPKNPENSTFKPSQKLSIHSQQRSSRESNKDTSNHKIIAEIDLVESDDEYMDDDEGDDDDEEDDDDDDDGTLPLAAFSCELKCDDDDVADVCKNNSSSFSRNPSYNTNYAAQRGTTTLKYSKPLVDDVVIVGTHENKNSDDMMVRWEEYEGQRERVFFECFLCGKKVQSSYNLRRHMMIHTGERPFGCDLCDRRFREFSDMKKHRRRHSHELKYLCMICNERPPLDNDPTRCINCCTLSKNAVIVASMNRATDVDSSSEQSAPIKATNVAAISQSSTAASQQQTLPTISSVRSYNTAVIRTKSPPASKSTSSTSAANGSSSNSSSSTNNNVDKKSSEKTQRFLENIPAVHRPGYNELGMITRKEFPCPLCNRAFGTRHNLKRHYMIHTGEKPFSCTKCRKPFREYSTLKKHMVTHMRERWYKCMRCPLKFRDFLKYTDHKQSHRSDSDSEEKPMAVYTKYNSMQSDFYLDSNDEDSGGEDWLECCECGERFNEIDAYNDHVKEHDASNQVFQCYICKQQLKSRAELDQHIKQQHKLDMTDSMDDDKEDITGA